MKLKYLVAIVILKILVDFSQSAFLDDKFKQFKEYCNKTYDSEDEEGRRKMTFGRNLKLIINSNKNADNSFKLGVNCFADIDRQEMANLASGLRGNDRPIQGRNIGFLKPGGVPTATETFVNWMSTGCVSGVKDQSYYCNSCWAFSSIAALEYYCCMKYKEPFVLSEQQLIDCNVNPTSGNWGCNGGNPATAYFYAMQNGIQSMDSYPYLQTSPTETPFPCQYDKTKTQCKPIGYMRIPPRNETLLRDVVANIGPVSAAMYGLWPSFWLYYDGIYDDESCPARGTHSVLIVGYGTDVVDGVNKDYWLCKNSWSEEWGFYGYFKIARGKNICGITSYLIYPIV